jgi:cell division septation protein DedD
VPLIRADQGATKVKPTDTGGADVPGRDMQVYNPSQPGARVEHLLPAPEQPLAKPLALPASADASAPLPLQEIGPTPTPKSAPPIPGSGNVMPTTTTSGVLTATSSAPLPPPPTSSTAVSNPIALAPPVAAVAAPKPAQVAAAGGSFRVQIAATRDEATARSEFERLKKAHADLLGELSGTVVKADLGDKGVFYRVQAGPVADHDKAEKLCTELKKFSIACIIVKP